MIRKPPEISAGSMADIAFLLLIFFLVSTTMNFDTGIMRRLPPPVDDEPTPYPIQNVLQVYVNSQDELMVDNEIIGIENLRSIVKDFLTPRPEMSDDLDYAQTKEMDAKFIGTVHKSKGVVSMYNDRGTTYEMYIQVQNEIAAAIRELRNDFSKKHFGMEFQLLEKLHKNKAKVIKDVIPIAVSEAEPVDFAM